MDKTTELDKLEALAKAATPGPWVLCKYGSVMDDAKNWEIVPAEASREDREFIAAANPAAILELIALARAGIAAPTGQQAEPVATVEENDEDVSVINAVLPIGTKLYTAPVSAAPAAPTAAAALAPFAKIADLYDEREDDSHEVWIDQPETRITLGQCRAARAALAAPTAAVEPTTNKA